VVFALLLDDGDLRAVEEFCRLEAARDGHRDHQELDGEDFQHRQKPFRNLGQGQDRFVPRNGRCRGFRRDDEAPAAEAGEMAEIVAIA